jgi:predicted CXXCH cytochrome family protein
MIRTLFVFLFACYVVTFAARGVQEQPPIAPPSPAQPPVAKAERPTTEIPREGCVTSECHQGVKSYRYLHGPVNANACDSCHKLKDAAAHTFEFLRPREQVCTFCHTVELPAGMTMHEPFAAGECLTCHNPHGSTESAMLRGEKYADSCTMCHKDMVGGHDRAHGPASAGACGACHQPHASRFPKLLNAPGRELCLRCHLSTSIQVEKCGVVHKPVLGDCLVCHSPHATDNPSMLNSDPVKLCTECHNDIGETMDNATTPHAALTTKRSCLNCHFAHASDRSHLLKNEETALCLECHNVPISQKDGSKLLNMQTVLAQGKSLHGAIAQQSCAACHQIHGGGHRRLLVNEYPSEVYYPFSETAYALCFSCHDKQLVLQQQTSTVTNFRNGDRNLHFVHVNKADKGRSCRVCHDSHAATRDRHIRDEIPYGPKGWKLPLKYESFADGGRCGAGCHMAYEYNRAKPVVYPTAQDGAWKGTDLVPGVRSEPHQTPSSGDTPKTK